MWNCAWCFREFLNFTVWSILVEEMRKDDRQTTKQHADTGGLRHALIHQISDLPSYCLCFSWCSFTVRTRMQACICICLHCTPPCFVCVSTSPISRCMERRGPAPRLEGDLRLLRGLFLARPHRHHAVPPTCCCCEPTHPSQRQPRQRAWPLPGNERFYEAAQWGERTLHCQTYL